MSKIQITFDRAIFQFLEYSVVFIPNVKPCKHFYDVEIINKELKQSVIISTSQAANKSNAISLIKFAAQNYKLNEV